MCGTKGRLSLVKIKQVTEMSDPSESAATLALMARMAIALGNAAGIGADRLLYIQTPGGDYVSWAVPLGQLHVFAGLPRLPDSRRMEVRPHSERLAAINGAYPMPPGWIHECASRLQRLRSGYSDGYFEFLAVNVWRHFVRRNLPPPAEAVELWAPMDQKLTEWALQYADLVAAEAQRTGSDIDPEAPGEIGRAAALDPQYLCSTPEQAFFADQRRHDELAKDRPPLVPRVIQLRGDEGMDRAANDDGSPRSPSDRG